MLEQLVASHCHQQAGRALVFAGEPMALCARCMGLYLGVAVVGGWLVWRRWRGHRPWAPRGWWVPLALVLALGLLDAVSGVSYRLALGNGARLVLGYGLGLALTAMVGLGFARWFPERRTGNYRDRMPAGMLAAAVAAPACLLGLRMLPLGEALGWACLATISLLQLAGFGAGVLVLRRGLDRTRWRLKVRQPATWRAARGAALMGGSALLLSGCDKVDNPFLITPAYLAWCGASVSICLALLVLRRKAWKTETEQVRALVLEKLGLPPGEASVDAAAQRILALVPTKAKDLAGQLEQLEDQKRVWLCFFPSGMVAISSDGSSAMTLEHKQMQKLCLGDGELGIEIQGSTSTFAVERLDDLVRIVNILTKQGITLRYLP